MKKVLWIVGSNATGKTSQSKELHKRIGNGDKKIHKWTEGDEVVKYTTFGNSIGHVGIVGDNQCTGTDTINSKKSLEDSYIYCLNECDIVILDGIMATSQWSPIINQFPASVKTYIVLLQFNTLEENLKRIAERRACKIIEKNGNDGGDIADFEYFVEDELEKINENEKTVKNVSGKFKGFKSLYEKVRCEFNFSMEIDASLGFYDINKKIFSFLENE